jgi:hypothetical protein
MRSTVRQGLLTILAACLFGASGMATAAGAVKDCSQLGTWLEVKPGTHELAGFLATASGQSNNQGTLVVENPGFGSTFGDLFPGAVGGSQDRGVWERTGGRTFSYSLIGTFVDSSGVIVWIRKIYGTITMIDNCKTEKLTAVMAVYQGTDNPFEGTPIFEVDLGALYAYRFTLP